MPRLGSSSDCAAKVFAHGSSALTSALWKLCTFWELIFPLAMHAAATCLVCVKLALIWLQEDCLRGLSLLLLTAFVGLALDNTPGGVAAGVVAAASAAAWEKMLSYTKLCA